MWTCLCVHHHGCQLVSMDEFSHKTESNTLFYSRSLKKHHLVLPSGLVHISWSVLFFLCFKKLRIGAIKTTETICIPSHSLDHPGSVPQQWNGLIHQRMGLHKVQHLIRQRGRGAKSGSLHCTSSWSAGEGRKIKTGREREDNKYTAKRRRGRGSCWRLLENICWIVVKIQFDGQLKLIAEEKADYIWDRCSGQQHCSMPPGFSYIFFCIIMPQQYLGLGTASSGTGVQIDSGDFCSLNRPSNTWASCCMSNTHTAEPGMLPQKKTKTKHSWGKSCLCVFVCKSCASLYLFGGVEKRPSMTSRPCMWIIPEVACKRLK